MLFKSYWRKLIERLIDQTPGLGHEDEANRAVKRSERTIRDAERVNAVVADKADYLAEIKRRNHFRDHVADVLTVRRAVR